MKYWLLKTEPDTYSWTDLQKQKKAVWDGIHNFQARKNLMTMKKGDWAFFYHTGDEKAIVGIALVVKEAYPDPKEPDWQVIEIAPVKPLKKAVTLSEIKGQKRLANMVLARVPRLSVQPVAPEEFELVLAMSGTK